MRVKPLLCAGTALFAAVVMISADNKVTQQARVDDFLNHYYQAPAPERIPEFLQAAQALGLTESKNGRPPTLGFLTEIIATNPDRIAGWDKQIPESSVALRRLWNEAIQLNRAGGVRSVTDHSPNNNDMNWGAFSATGHEDFVRRVLAEVPYLDERTDRNLYVTGTTACWSLCSNARSHPKVRQTLEAAKADATPRTRAIIDQILTADPGSYRASMIEVIRQQRQAGKW